MFELHKLESSGKKRKRVGRGGSRGGTSGKGHKGQKARSGGTVSARFEGGQMPLFRRLPKRGFNNTQFKVDVKVVNIGDLSCFDDNTEVTRDLMISKGLVVIKKAEKKSAESVQIKILGNGKCSKKLVVHANAFSKSAQELIEQAGGKVIKG